MTLAQTYSWIFYAIGLASKTAACTTAEVENIADGINHARPSQKEMQASVWWTASKGLILKDQKRLQLTAEGIALLSDARSASNTALGVWKYIENRFTELGADNSMQVNPNNLMPS